MTAPQIRWRTSTTLNVAISLSPRITRIGIPIFTPCFSPMLPTTSDHSSFTLITLPFINVAVSAGGFSAFAINSFRLRSCVSTSIRACASPPVEVLSRCRIASLNRKLWSRYCSRSFCNNCRSDTALSNRCSSFARSLSADSSPNASIRSSRSEYFRRKTSACRFDSARLSVNVRTDSRASESSLRSASFCESNSAAVTFVSAFSTLDSVKELFPCAASSPAEQTLPTNKIIDPRLTTAAFSNRKSKIENRKLTSLRHLRGVRTVLLKDSGRRKLAEFVADNVLRHEHGNKSFAVVHHEGVADEIRRHHRAAGPGLHRLLHARRIHLVDFFEKMRGNERSFFQSSGHN